MDYMLQKIRGLQEKNKLTGKDFADEIGITPQALYNYYSGKTQISIKNLTTIANIFNVPVSYFFEEENLEKKNITAGGDVQIGSKNSNNKTSAENCTQYKEKIALLEKTIEDKNEIIKLLKNK